MDVPLQSGPTNPEASGKQDSEQGSPKVVNYIRPAAIVARQLSLPHYGGDTDDPKLFKLWSTFPWQLRKHSAFLALHFGSIGLFVILLLGYSALSVWPLQDTIRAGNYRRQFTVIDPTNATICEPTEKPYQAGNFILRMSLGNFCSSNNFSSPLDCCTRCIADIPEEDPEADPVCSLNPCPYRFTWSDKEVFESGCCVFNQQLSEEQAANATLQQRRVHDWGDEITDNEMLPRDKVCRTLPLHHIQGCLSLFWLAVTEQSEYLQTSLAEASNRTNVNVSQYSVLLSNVGDVECDQKRLQEFGRYSAYRVNFIPMLSQFHADGDVVSVFYVRNYGRFLHKNTQIQQAKDLLKEIRYLKQETQHKTVDTGTGLAIQGRFSSFPHSLYALLYKRYLCGFKSMDGMMASLEKKCESLDAEVETLSKEPDEATGSAVIVFNWVQDAANMLFDHNLRNRLANVFVPPSFGKAFNVATQGKYTTTPKIALTKESTEDGEKVDEHRYVAVARAPEPSDWWWENTRFGGQKIVRRRIISWLAYVALLGLSLFVMINLNILATVETNDVLYKALTVKNQVVARRNLKDAWDEVSAWKWTLIKTLANLFFSELGLIVIQYLADYSLFYTRTQSVGSQVTKIAVFQLFNSFAVPLAAFSFDHVMNNLLNRVQDQSVGRRLWFSTGGFVDVAFTIQLFNAVLPHLAFIFRTDDIINLHFLSHMACTQTYVDNTTQPPPFRMVQISFLLIFMCVWRTHDWPVQELRLGQAITTVGLSILYAPILPLSPFLGLLGMVFQYATDQYIALRHSSKPRSFQVYAFQGANYVLILLPLLQLGLMWGLYFIEIWDEISRDMLIGFVVWLCLTLIPITNLFRQRQYTRWVQAGRPRLLDWAKHPGERAGTWTNTMKLENTGLGGPLWVNFDTFLPDVPSLDPQIFTDCIKPHFEYHSPPLQRFDRKDSASGRQSLRPKIRPQRYAYVEPVSAFKDALSAAGKAMGAAGKAVGAAGMAVLNFGSNQNGSEPSTSRQEEWGGSPSSSKVPSSSRRNSSQLKPVVNPEKEEEKPETDVLKTYGVPEFVPDF